LSPFTLSKYFEKKVHKIRSILPEIKERMTRERWIPTMKVTGEREESHSRDLHVEVVNQDL
jgi:hypothetical protein